jgi:hypothetical protein
MVEPRVGATPGSGRAARPFPSARPHTVMGAMRARIALPLVLTIVLGACAAAPTPTPTPQATPPPAERNPLENAVGRAMAAEFAPNRLIATLPGGAACRSHAQPGSEGNGEVRLVTTIRCREAPGDRTIAFLLAEAIEPELARLGLTVRHSSALQEADDPTDVVLRWTWFGTSPGLRATVELVVVDASGELVFVVTTNMAAS